MSVDFKKFDELVDQKKLKEELKNADVASFDDVPEGEYIVGIENMEVKPTKNGDKLMFSVACKIKETIDAPNKQNNRWIFFNRVIFGNKTTDRWNDGVAIKGILTWLKEFTDDIEFNSYSQFASDIEELFEDIKDNTEVHINYSPDEFNPISIIEVFDI